MKHLKILGAHIMSLRRQVRAQRQEIWELQARLTRLKDRMYLKTRQPPGPAMNRKGNRDASC